MAHPLLTRLVALGIFLGAGAAWAKGDTDPYEAARDAEAQLNYKAVLMNASRALETAQPHEHLVQLYRMLGTANGVLGKSNDAIDAFTKLLAIDPDHKLPRGTSPKITGPFREAGGYWVDRPKGLQVLPALPTEISVGKSLTVPVKLEDPLGMTANVRMSWRLQGDVEYKNMEAPMSPNVSFTIPADQIPTKTADYNLELFVTALGSTGSELRLNGDPASPLSVVVRVPKTEVIVHDGNGNNTVVVSGPPKEKKPLIKQWWLWTAVGAVVVVGAAVGGGLGWFYGRPDTTHTDIGITSKPLLTF
jgi:hypothetical protein